MAEPARQALVWFTARTAATLFPLAGWPVTAEGTLLRAPGNRAVRVVKDCDGLTAMLLFAAAVGVTPTRVHRRLVFGALGTTLLFLLNQARIAHLLHLSGQDPERFRLAHETAWPALLLVAAAALFLVWARREASHA